MNNAMLRYERSIRLLGAGTIALWLLAAAVIASWFSFYFIFAAPILDAVMTGSTINPEHLKVWRLIMWWGHALLWAATIMVFIAASTTVLLVRVMRRATLGQVSRSLISIAEQLRDLSARLPPENQQQKRP
jgi:hypothetical protein